MNVFEGLLSHFQDIADAFGDEKLAAAVLPGVTEQGSSKEDLLVSFLASHLPERCQFVRGGRLFDSDGNVSKRIDLMVAGELALRYSQREECFHCLEGCYCAICVSDMLDRNACFDSLERLASVPVVPEVPPGMGFLYGIPETARDLPIKVVFAFGGAGAEATLAQIEEFYSAGQIPERARPNLVIVNNAYGILRTGKEGAVTASGIEVPPDTYHVFGSAQDEPRIGGYSLMYLLTEVQRAVAAGSQRIPDFATYLDQLPL